MSYNKCQKHWRTYYTFSINLNDFAVHQFSMLVDGCNFAQLTAQAYRAMCFNCAALQAVHYFLKHENLFRSYI